MMHGPEKSDFSVVATKPTNKAARAAMERRGEGKGNAKRFHPQGNVVSPLLANVFRHYVYDLRVNHWHKYHARGHLIVVRYADDAVVGSERADDAQRFLMVLRERLEKFSLAIHPDKTRLIEVGRFAARDRKERGLGKSESFDFLGLTHICSHTSSGTGCGKW